MASKTNTKKLMAICLTINLVLLGYTSAQEVIPPVVQPVIPPVVQPVIPPVASLVCPLSPLQLQVCVRVLFISIILNTGTAAPCCNLLSGLSPPVASTCACDAARVRLLNLVDLRVRLNSLLNICGVQAPSLSCPI